MQGLKAKVHVHSIRRDVRGHKRGGELHGFHGVITWRGPRLLEVTLSPDNGPHPIACHENTFRRRRSPSCVVLLRCEGSLLRPAVRPGTLPFCDFAPGSLFSPCSLPQPDGRMSDSDVEKTQVTNDKTYDNGKPDYRHGSVVSITEDFGADSELQRRLSTRHITMIALGSSIGMGLWLGSGTSLTSGGPAAMFIGYILSGTMIWAVSHSIGEMAVMYPLPSAVSISPVDCDRLFRMLTYAATVCAMEQQVRRPGCGLRFGLELLVQLRKLCTFVAMGMLERSKLTVLVHH